MAIQKYSSKTTNHKPYSIYNINYYIYLPRFVMIGIVPNSGINNNQSIDTLFI